MPERVETVPPTTYADRVNKPTNQQSSSTHENVDVRMRGFALRTTVEASLAWLDRQLQPLDAEYLPLAMAADRVLAQPILSAAPTPW